MSLANSQWNTRHAGLTLNPLQLIKKLSATPTLAAQNDVDRTVTPVNSQAALQANKATFFFQLVTAQARVRHVHHPAIVAKQ